MGAPLILDCFVRLNMTALKIACRRRNPDAGSTRIGSLMSVRNDAASPYGSYRRNRKYENKSSTLFCNGVPDKHQRHFEDTALTAAATCDRAFFTDCASSRITRNHSTPPTAPPDGEMTLFSNPGAGPVSSAGASIDGATSSPTTANVVSTTSYAASSAASLVRPTPWCTSTRMFADLLTLLSSSRCHCLSTDVGHTTSVPPAGLRALLDVFVLSSSPSLARRRGGGGFAAMSAMALNVLPRPWSSASIPPRGLEPAASLRRIHDTARLWCFNRGIASMVSGIFSNCSSSSSKSFSSRAKPSRTVSIAAAVFTAVASLAAGPEPGLGGSSDKGSSTHTSFASASGRLSGVRGLRRAPGALRAAESESPRDGDPRGSSESLAVETRDSTPVLPDCSR
mmetsp:Transcript_6231/g.26482  ORF Transcript_6231/g.26482 Transcript_6231/m.26482 type:complete len:396 (+) Transcript_6231:1061-2248(+)